MKTRLATTRIRQNLVENMRNYVNNLIDENYDYIYEELITTQSLELLATMAWPLMFYNRGKIDLLFSKLEQDPDNNLADALSLAFQMDEDGCRTGVFRGFAEGFISNKWDEFDDKNAKAFVDGRYAVLSADTPERTLIFLFSQQKDDTYLVDLEALWLFSMALRTSIILDIADQALNKGHDEIALEYYALAAQLRPAYTRIENLVCKHMVIGKFITPQRKYEIHEQLQLTAQAQERCKLLKKDNSLKNLDSLELEEYEKILKVITDMALVMERSPDAFKGLREEHIRNHFLVQLNGRYPGNATGETFNGLGKADIVLRRDGVNLFVAECKFWKSQQHFKSAIDQLLRYATWRDTKLALILFNRNKSLTDVVSKVMDIVRSHPCCKKELEYQSDTGGRFLVYHPNDENRILIMTVMVFEIPN